MTPTELTPATVIEAARQVYGVHYWELTYRPDAPSDFAENAYELCGYRECDYEECIERTTAPPSPTIRGDRTPCLTHR